MALTLETRTQAISISPSDWKDARGVATTLIKILGEKPPSHRTSSEWAKTVEITVLANSNHPNNFP